MRYKYYLLNWKWMTCFLTFECAKVYFAIFCFFSLPPYWKSYELFMYARQCSKLRKNKIVILQLRWCRDLTNCSKKWFFKKCCLYPETRGTNRLGDREKSRNPWLMATVIYKGNNNKTKEISLGYRALPKISPKKKPVA